MFARIAGFTPLAVWLLVSPLAAQPSSGDVRSGVLPLVPTDALLVVERRGHTAVREAFLASNLGKMSRREEIQNFVHGSRVQIGKWIMKEMFDLQDPTEIDRWQKTLHEFLKPFWYQPCAAFLVVKVEGRGSGPQFGFICATGKYRAECKAALEKLAAFGVPRVAGPGTRQAFTYKQGLAVWKGVAKHYDEFTLPEDGEKRTKALADKSLFMHTWLGGTLFLATGLDAADSLSRMVSLTGRRKSISQNPSLAVVLKKTAVKDWAFRWFFNAEAARKMLPKEGRSARETARVLKALGVDKVRGVGGSGGYADHVFVRRTYVHAPGYDRGILRFMVRGGSYKKAHAMAPNKTSFCLAGQNDPKAIVRMIRELAEATTSRSGPTTRPAGPESRPAPPESRPALPDESFAALKQLNALATASDGRLAVFVTDLQPMMGGPMAGGPPIGFALGVKDPAKAAKALVTLLKMAGIANSDVEDTAPRGKAAPGKAGKTGKTTSTYRKVAIRQLHSMLSMAVMKDRILLAMDDSVMKASIDAALEGTGGFPPNSQGAKLAQLAGDGPVLFVMDMPALVRAFWPSIVQLAGQAQTHGGGFPLVSLPPAKVLADLLTPEVAVLSPDEDGLMMRSTGMVPFVTKYALTAPVYFFMIVAMMGF